MNNSCFQVTKAGQFTTLIFFSIGSFRYQKLALSQLQKIASALNGSKYLKPGYERNLYESTALAQAADTPALKSIINIDSEVMKNEVNASSFVNFNFQR